jgi:hypothetical protein
MESVKKVECLNPHTGRRMNIDAPIYNMVSKAVYHSLKKNPNVIAYAQIVTEVKKYFKERKTSFKRSVEWYTVTVKNDLEAKGIIKTHVEKGKKLNRLK